MQSLAIFTCPVNYIETTKIKKKGSANSPHFEVSSASGSILKLSKLEASAPLSVESTYIEMSIVYQFRLFIEAEWQILFGQDSVTSSNFTNSASAFPEPSGTDNENHRRRFSNLSNLAQSLPSSSSCTSAFPVAGSLDLVRRFHSF